MKRYLLFVMMYGRLLPTLLGASEAVVDLEIQTSRTIYAGYPGGTEELSVAIAGDAAYSIHWERVDGQPLPADRASGVESTHLRLTALEPADAGKYRAVVGTDQATLTSEEITLVLRESFVTWWERLYGLPIPAPGEVEAGWTVSNFTRYALGLTSPTDQGATRFVNVAPNTNEVQFRINQKAMIWPVIEIADELPEWRRFVSISYRRGPGTTEFQWWVITMRGDRNERYFRLRLRDAETELPPLPPNVPPPPPAEPPTLPPFLVPESPPVG